MKYSFVIPIHNGENYIDKCLKSVFSQTYKNFEVIIVNDGSTDKSLEMLKKYKEIRLYSTKSKGVSNARNYGIEKATGDFFIFVDIDDYISSNMLEYLNKNITKDIDLVKYNCLESSNQEDTSDDSCEVLTGPEAFNKLVAAKIPFDLTCIYAYNTKFWKKNKFSFSLNRYHEDFGIIPYAIIKSKKIMILNKVLYYYVQSQESITRGDNVEKKVRNFHDILYHFDNLYEKVNNDKKIDMNVKKLFNSYIANAVILSYKNLNKDSQKLCKSEVIKRKVTDLLMDNTFLRKIKKIIYKMML
jgi:glycosyltransferase involved in cell wall biosynthesis